MPFNTQVIGVDARLIGVPITLSLIIVALINPAIRKGQFNHDAFCLYGMIASGIMPIIVLVLSLSTHRRIPMLKSPPPAQRKTLRIIVAKISETLADRSFLTLFVMMTFGLIASSVSTVLILWMAMIFALSFDKLICRDPEANLGRARRTPQRPIAAIAR